MNLPYRPSPYAAAPAYAPYAPQYQPPRYPLVSLVGQAPPAPTPAPAPGGVMGFFQQRAILGIPNWALAAGALSLLTVAMLNARGAFDGGSGAPRRRASASRDLDFSSLFLGDAGRSSSKRRSGGSRSRSRSASSRSASTRRRSGGSRKRSGGFSTSGGRGRSSSRRRSGGRSSGRGRRDYGFLDF